jgi:hypothetical protein
MTDESQDEPRITDEELSELMRSHQRDEDTLENARFTAKVAAVYMNELMANGIDSVSALELTEHYMELQVTYRVEPPKDEDGEDADN